MGIETRTEPTSTSGVVMCAYLGAVFLLGSSLSSSLTCELLAVLSSNDGRPF